MTGGDRLPRVRTEIPGPASRALAMRLARVESRNVTHTGPDGPVFWLEAAGASVIDVDGNRYIDLTAGFGVAAAGHSNPKVADAVSRQFALLAHAMGDVHPAAVKVELLERLAAIAPGELGVAILSANGSDAVESALKTAALATGRPGVVAFHGGYHGLGFGSLGVTGIPRFRQPFERQLYGGVRFARFPVEPETSVSTSVPRPPSATQEGRRAARGSVEEVRRLVVEAGSGPDPVGAVIVEPIQGRAGIRVPPPSFLPELRSLCDELDLVLILDEVYTGLGRTGAWFACDHTGVVPDLLVIGKSLAGGLPLSAVVGRREVMEGWPASEGEALHTSTFLGNPVTAAAALAHLREIEDRGLVQQAARTGIRLRSRLDSWVAERPWAAGARGVGLMQALRLAGPDPGAAAQAAMAGALKAGVLILPEGDALAFTPPLVITEVQLDHALDLLAGVLDKIFDAAPGRRAQ